MSIEHHEPSSREITKETGFKILTILEPLILSRDIAALRFASELIKSLRLDVPQWLSAVHVEIFSESSHPKRHRRKKNRKGRKNTRRTGFDLLEKRLKVCILYRLTPGIKKSVGKSARGTIPELVSSFINYSTSTIAEDKVSIEKLVGPINQWDTATTFLLATLLDIDIDAFAKHIRTFDRFGHIK